ncbi:putative GLYCEROPHOSPHORYL DIESTER PHOSPHODIESTERASE GLPQ1 domain protein [Mycobacterium xenopi 3993]|nr:putative GLYCEROPHOSPHORYL DIESTER PHOSPHODIESTERASE GLPQ1 domain protein [Mycobacterium xenopi 3993]
MDRAAAQGRALYCWNVDHFEDVEFCREVGVAWIATHYPAAPRRGCKTD